MSDPTLEPTQVPSVHPTTPSPTHPGELVCGDREQGAYNELPLHIRVRILYYRQLTLNAAQSDFKIATIDAFDSRNRSLATKNNVSELTTGDLKARADVLFVIHGVAGVRVGVYDTVVLCVSDSLTAAPTQAPTTAPTRVPSMSCG